MSEHTALPWKMVIHAGIGGTDYIQILAGSWDIAHNRHSTRDWEEELANAHLIIAAPNLFAACERLLMDCNLFRRGGYWICPFCQAECAAEFNFAHKDGCPVLAARAAIAKAKGTP